METTHVDHPRAPIRILIVEDDQVCAALLSLMLGRCDQEGLFQLRVVRTLTQALDLVYARKTDAVLLDLNLPDSKGIATLEMLMGACRLPIVVLTDSDNIAVAMRAVEAGAQDYLVKGEDQAHHVVRAVVHAIERHRHLKRLSISEQRFQDFAEVSSDWLWETDPNLRFSWVSDHVRDVLGIDPAVMVGKGYLETISLDDDPSKVAAHFARLERRESFRNFVFRPANAPGKHVRACGRPVFSRSGKFLGYRGNGADVTDEMESQVFAASMLAVLMDSLAAFPSGVMIFDTDDCLLMANERAGLLLPCCSDCLVPGTPFTDILASAARSGLFIDGEERLDEWLAEWRECKAREEGTFSEPTRAGPVLYFHQYRTGTGGVLRIVRHERRSPHKVIVS